MRSTPSRPNLFTDISIPRRATLQYIKSGERASMELEGLTLSDDAIDILNDPASYPYLSITLSPDNLEDAPLLRDYYIKKFLITDYHQDEQILEIRLEPWRGGPKTDHRRNITPTAKVINMAQMTLFNNITIWIVTLHAGQRSCFSIDSSARFNLQHKRIDL